MSTKQRLFYTVKLSSSFIKNKKYNITLNFDKCLKNGYIVSLADSQMLRSIRSITNHNIDYIQLEEWYKERDQLKKSKNNSTEKKNRVKELQSNINNMMYIPEYITVVMDSINDYEYLFYHGFTFNGHTYKRGSCSASQARVSTIVFVDTSIKDELNRRLNNGRYLDKPLSPSKFNAYYGLYSSSTKKVTKPRFCIVPDCNKPMTHTVDFVIEKDDNTDDVVEERTITSEENRFDGSGLISPYMAEQWGRDLGEDYTPCNFCLRYAFTKGMVNTFDFLAWCDEYNGGNYIIKDIYNNDVDLRNIDVILGEGMAKLWNFWDSQEAYEQCCEENEIYFGITKYSPKKEKRVLLNNYQYLQTLNINNKQDIEAVCRDTVDYIKGVSYEDPYYSLLFMMGENTTPENIPDFMLSSDNYWLKSCILNHNLLTDKYSKEKVRDMIVRRIEQACLGRIITRGNYTCICPDPFAYMEWICYRDVSKVNGLLKAGEAYCQFWNEKGITKVDALRSPLTHFSEHGIDNICNTPDMQKWYKYCYSGYIANIHDEFTYVHAGSDYDYDIIATTDCPQFVNGKYPNQKVVTYDVKKPKKSIFTEDDLFTVDTFSFGNSIGSITNTCSSICALIPVFPEGSKERKLLEDRLKAGCAAQSRQIDKTKIGGSHIKTLSTTITQYQKVKEEDTPEIITQKEFYNSILADKKPYFFKYKYKTLSKELKKFIYDHEEGADIHFHTTLNNMIKQYDEDKNLMTKEERDYIYWYKEKYPVLDTDCVMNNICKYIESIDFEIKKKVRTNDNFDYHTLMSEHYKINKNIHDEIEKVIINTFREWEIQLSNLKKKRVESELSTTIQDVIDKDSQYLSLKNELEGLGYDSETLTNHLIYIFYVTHENFNKSSLWKICGKQIYENIKKNNSVFYFPILNDGGNINFLYDTYMLQKFNIEEEEEKIKAKREEMQLLKSIDAINYWYGEEGEEF